MLTKWDVFASIQIIILATSLFYLAYTSHEECKKCSYCKEVIVSSERMSLYNKSINRPNTRVNGVYFKPEYFCVWTKDRTPEQINYTFCHEGCHDMVYREHEHFCGGSE